ncbi:hypothetical protein MASR2M79_04760 [Aminivibrio sp.]
MPDAVDDSNITGEEHPATITAADGVLKNDTDPDGDDLAVSFAVGGVSGNVGIL